jgi:hypothetical protein
MVILVNPLVSLTIFSIVKKLKGIFFIYRFQTTSETGTAYISAYFEFIPGLACGGFRIDESLLYLS